MAGVTVNRKSMAGLTQKKEAIKFSFEGTIDERKV